MSKWSVNLVEFVIQVLLWFCVQAAPAPPSLKHAAPPRPVPSAEAGRRQSSGLPAQQSAVPQSHVISRSTSSSAAPPRNNNNVIYSNTNDVIDWTDDEWDDEEDDVYDEDMQVP